MCRVGCVIDPKTRLCRVCGTPLSEIMNRLKVPQKDQEHTINWLIYRQYQ